MTENDYINKVKELQKLKKRYKYLVIHDDSATKINQIKELICKLDGEIKAYLERFGHPTSGGGKYEIK